MKSLCSGIFAFFSHRPWLFAGVLFGGLFLPLWFREWALLQKENHYDVEWHTTSITTLLQHDLESVHPLPELLDQIDIDDHRAELDRYVKQKIGHLGLLKLKIYNNQGTIIYASDSSLLGKNITGDAGYRKALSGTTTSAVVHQDEYLHEYGESAQVDMAEVYVPIPDNRGTDVSYILEAYYDYTPFQQRTQRLLVRNSVSLAVTILAFILIYSAMYRHKKRLSRKIDALEALLPICQYCKKIRIEAEGDPDRWEAIEAYFSAKDQIKFSHGICDDCMALHYPELKKPSSRNHSANDS